MAVYLARVRVSYRGACMGVLFVDLPPPYFVKLLLPVLGKLRPSLMYVLCGEVSTQTSNSSARKGGKSPIWRKWGATFIKWGLNAVERALHHLPNTNRYPNT